MSTFEDTTVGETTTTATRTITETDVVNFNGLSGDFNEIHTSTEAMKDSEYGERLVHGALVFSILTGLQWQTQDDQGDGVVAFYGVDKLRFTAPVFIDDTIHAEFEVVDKELRDHPVATGLIRRAASVYNQDEDVVLACEMVSLVE